MSGNIVNTALEAVSPAERKLGFSDHLALWGSLGVGLLVIQAGTFLVPALSAAHAMAAIVLGSLIGVSLLAWVGWLGAQSGVSSAGLIWPALGRRFATLPVAANVLQLLGWSVFEIIVLRDGLSAIARQQLGIDSPAVFTILTGLLLLGLLRLSMVGIVRQFIRRAGLILMLVALGWLTVRFAGEVATAGWAAFWGRAGDGSMGFGAAVDLVVAMPISWLPLVADYTRYSKNSRSVVAGIGIGYTVANIWCFALAILIAAVHPGGDMIATIMLAGSGALALGLLLVDEVDNAYGDLYSAAVSSHGLLPKLPVGAYGPLLAIVATVIALTLPIQDYQGFLYLLGSVFVPLFGVVIAHHGKHPLAPSATTPAIVWPGALAWLAGIAVYQLISRLAPDWGASLPALAVAFVLYHVLASAGLRRLQAA
ncbi:hypothetical protein IGB42_03371 [Andreprevotia sp. IGB-42]|uniref:cytosine permease n=1 Tax=Andreprevotia sp. IGB-42 TaxID=2497473 RepID=UPI00135BFF6E|nr:cytosine permease [Andreprevotia sp. IGB-42]KAF0812094.1 hypothetical protein IGB42_03371 [Andreprevotia sp. IGB-42]